MKPTIHKGDLFGGLGASAVILPQATAFGIAIWTPFGISAASAALAGLITTICLCLFSGLARGSAGVVSAPTGPTMVLLSGALVTFTAAGYGGEQLVALIALVIFLSGLMQIAIGLGNGGRLIKFIPYPVVTGFITGSAVLMIASQFKLLQAKNYAHIFDENLWVIWLTAASSFVAMMLGTRYFKKLPDTLSGLLFGTVVFHLLTWLFRIEYPDTWLVGSLPTLSELKFVNPLEFHSIPWAMVLPVSAALAVLAATNNMLTAVIADAATNMRHHAKRELTGQGIGLVISALLGGIAGSATTGATQVAVQGGGRYGVALISALIFFLIIVLFGPIAAVLPVSVLAAVILHVAIMSMIKWEMLIWLKRRTSRLDGITALLVVAVTVAYNLMMAIGVGLLLATFQFVRAQILSPVIHRHSNLAQRPSVRQRSPGQRQLLDEHADQVQIYELTGNLFFGTVDHLFEKLSGNLNKPVTVILDMARVQQVDLTAVHMFKQMADRIHKSSGEMVFTNVRKGKGLSHKVEKSLRRISAHHGGNYPVKTFIDADEAIEYAENKLLESLGVDLHENQRVELAEGSLFSEMPKVMVNVLHQYMTPVSLKSGDYLFRISDAGDELYVVVEGDIDVLLPYSEYHYKRLSKCGPGAFLGEIAFLQQGTRTADAKAVVNTELLKLDREAFMQLRAQHPGVAIELMSRLAKELARRLRRTNDELQRLAG